MPAATVGMSPARAKAARQKKIAIAGAVLLVIVGAIQGPKLMKLLSGSSTSSTPAPAVTPPPIVPGTPATPVATAPAAGAATDRLSSFDTFSSKDPFIVQVNADGTGTSLSQSGSSGSSSGAAASSGGTGSSSTSSTASGATGSSTPAGGTLAASAGFTVAGSETTPPASPAFASASLEVNGNVTTVDQGTTFPKDDPVFKLASVSASSVVIGIAGGSLKTGGKTVTVGKGEQVTLQNTATGKRYRIKVVSTTPKG